MAVAPDARAGHTLGRYKLHEILGSGSMGVVYRGEHVYLGREVAIKVLRVGSARRGQAIKLFLREARAASRVSHHGIAAVTDFDKCADGTVFMAMELVRGEALDFLLERERRLDPERAINLVLQISDAIAAVHRHGIIHRDLKPANIMVRTRAEGSQPVREPVRTVFESIKLLDFGVANMYDPATGGWLAERRTIVGTAEYIAPEVVQGLAVDGRADIYSLGVILYEMFAGSVPFRGASAVDTMLKTAAEPVPSLRSLAPDLDVTPELDALLRRALAKRPEDRFPSVDAFMEHLRYCRSCLAGNPRHASPRRGRRMGTSAPPLGSASLPRVS
jgi:serine/threonine protein kinase